MRNGLKPGPVLTSFLIPAQHWYLPKPKGLVRVVGSGRQGRRVLGGSEGRTDGGMVDV